MWCGYWVETGRRACEARDSHYPEASARAAGFPENQDWRPIWREFAAGLRKEQERSR